MTVTNSQDNHALTSLASAMANGEVVTIDLTHTLDPDFPVIILPPEFGQCARFRMEEISAYDHRGPAWAFGMRSYGIAGDSSIVLRDSQDGRGRFRVIGLDGVQTAETPVTHTSMADVTVKNGEVVLQRMSEVLAE